MYLSNKDLRDIVPLIRPNTFGSANEAAIQGYLPENEAGEQMPVQMPFMADLVIAYAQTEPDRYRFISKRNLFDLQLTIEELHDFALKNLFQMVPELSVQDLVMYEAILTGNDLESSTILIDGVWEQLANESNGKLQMVVPTRDVVYFRSNTIGLEHDTGTISADTCLNVMVNAARDEWQENPSRRVSRGIFEWSGQGWTTVGRLPSDHA